MAELTTAENQGVEGGRKQLARRWVNPRRILEAIAADASVSAFVRVRACQVLLSHPATAAEGQMDQVATQAIARLRLN
jgi:hypothetical protein